MQLGATPSAAAAVIRATTSSVGSGSTSGSGINAPPINVPASFPPVGSRPTNDPLSQISSNLTSSTSLVSSVAAAAVSAAAARRSVSPPSNIPLGLDMSTSSAPHSPSPVGSLISKDNVNSQPSGGVPSPTYSQVRSFVKLWESSGLILTFFQGGQEYPPLSSSPLQLTPSLAETQIQRIADTAEGLIKAMSVEVEAKQLKNNKKVSKEVEVRFRFLFNFWY